MPAKKICVVILILFAFYFTRAGSFLFVDGDKEKKKLEKRIDTLESEIAALKVEVDSLAIQMARIVEVFKEIKKIEGYEAGQENSPGRDRSFTKIKGFQEQINSLNKRLAVLEKQRSEPVSKDTAKAEVAISKTKNNEAEKRNIRTKVNKPDTVAESAKNKSTPINETNNFDIETRYKQAIKLHRQGNHKKAIKEFEEIIGMNRQGNLADNAQFWIGACYKSMKQYDRAIVEFEEVLYYSGSNKKDDALYNIGRSLLAAGRKSKAEDIFTKLINEYPDSEFVNLAIKTMKEL